MLVDWFDRLVEHRYINAVLLANNQGNLVRSSRPFSSDDDLLPSMLQAFEVLAQTLTSEFGFGRARMILVTTEQEHILLFPLVDGEYYLSLIVHLDAPLMLVLVDIQHILKYLQIEDIQAVEKRPLDFPQPQLDTHEIILAVEEWLQQRNT